MTYQLFIGVVMAGIFWYSAGYMSALSAIFGMVSALSIAAFLGYGVIRANRVSTVSPHRSMMIIYFGAVQRFVLVLGLFIFGLGVLKLEPLAMAATFGLTQIAYAISLKQQAKT